MPEWTDRRKRGTSLNLGDVLHLVQIAVLLGSLGVGYSKYMSFAEQAGRNAEKLDRIEHYLSSKDPNYWRETGR